MAFVQEAEPLGACDGKPPDVPQHRKQRLQADQAAQNVHIVPPAVVRTATGDDAGPSSVETALGDTADAASDAFQAKLANLESAMSNMEAEHKKYEALNTAQNKKSKAPKWSWRPISKPAPKPRTPKCL